MWYILDQPHSHFAMLSWCTALESQYVSAFCTTVSFLGFFLDEVFMPWWVRNNSYTPSFICLTIFTQCVNIFSISSSFFKVFCLTETATTCRFAILQSWHKSNAPIYNSHRLTNSHHWLTYAPTYKPYAPTYNLPHAPTWKLHRPTHSSNPMHPLGNQSPQSYTWAKPNNSDRWVFGVCSWCEGFVGRPALRWVGFVGWCMKAVVGAWGWSQASKGGN